MGDVSPAQICKIFPGFEAHWRSFVDEQSTFGEYNRLQAGTTIINSRVGRFTYMSGARIKNSQVGAFCSIGEEVLIGGFSRHPVRWLTTHPAFFSTKKQAGFTFVDQDKFDEEAHGALVGNDVWIGNRVMVMDGVSVGDGAIVAAGAIVTKDVEPYSIVAGIPAKPIGNRFASEVVQELMEWKWWNLPMEILARIAPYFSQQEDWSKKDIQNFIQITKNAESDFGRKFATENLG